MVYIYICLYTYIRKRSIKSSSVAYLWRNICTVVYIRFVFLNNVATFKVCYCKLLQYDVRLALSLCLVNDRMLRMGIVNGKFLSLMTNYLTFAMTIFLYQWTFVNLKEQYTWRCKFMGKALSKWISGRNSCSGTDWLRMRISGGFCGYGNEHHSS